ncbi:focadhesin-like [Montipora capricornis]|uniref:focadhesin-like n=1 Tax=Montipora capricornis TaxID=246305 RepID=UPI0035F19CBF
MADEQRRRLTFSNHFHQQQQATLRLYESIVNKMTPGTVLNDKSPEIPDLKLLWEMIEEKSEAVNRLCCSCLLQLVFDGHAEFDYVLSGLLNAIPSARNLNGITEAVSSLLTFQLYQCATNHIVYKCMFTLRSPPHPFITVLTSRPDYAASLIQHVSCMLIDRYVLDVPSQLRILKFLWTQLIFIH